MITSSIFKGKIAYCKQVTLDIEFSGTRNEDNIDVDIVLNDRILLTQKLTTDVVKLRHMFSDEPGEHELKIVVRGNPQGAMLYIRDVRIEGLNMRNTFEHSGTCVMDNIAHVPSEHMGRPGHQSLKFTTPIYPWLLDNELKDTYYL